MALFLFVKAILSVTINFHFADSFALKTKKKDVKISAAFKSYTIKNTYPHATRSWNNFETLIIIHSFSIFL